MTVRCDINRSYMTGCQALFNSGDTLLQRDIAKFFQVKTNRKQQKFISEAKVFTN